jgi:hypothetical protein
VKFVFPFRGVSSRFALPSSAYNFSVILRVETGVPLRRRIFDRDAVTAALGPDRM